MSSEDGRLPPPPPLRSPLSPGLGGPLRDRHGLAQPPTITTALTGPQPTHSAWSASTLDTPYSPYASAGLSPVSQLPPSLSGSTSPLALRPPASFRMEYNPQQWGRGGPSGGEYRPHTRLAAPSGGADALNGMRSLCECSFDASVSICMASGCAAAVFYTSREDSQAGVVNLLIDNDTNNV